MMNKEAAIRMDEQDPLKIYRDEFYVKKGQYYLDGNSLGLLSRRAEKAVLSLLDSWKEYGIDGWTKGDNPWYYLSEKLGEMCAPLIGAKAGEVILTGSTTANLHQLLATFYKPQGKRVKILADELNFPTDLYAISSHLAVHNYDASYMKLVKSEDGHLLQEEAIIEAMTEEVAMVILPGVLYRSGQVLDIEKLTKAAHERDILIGFDLCHSIGSVPHELHNSGVDFAFWCNYKHLNGGPGSVAGIFVHEKHFGTRPGLAGWFGSDKSKQFDLSIEMTPADTAGAYQIGTPHILSLAPIYGSLEMFREVGIEAIRKKSLQLTQFFMDCIDQELAPFGFTLGNPKDKTRGGHIYLVHEEAARICSALKEAGVTPDFRAPNGIRLAPVALYNSFTDVWETVQILKDIMENEIYKKFENKRGVVA